MKNNEDILRYRKDKEAYYKNLLTAIRNQTRGQEMYDIMDSFCLGPGEDDFEEVYWFYALVFLTKGFTKNSERDSIISNCKYAMMAMDPKRFSGKDILLAILLAAYRRATTEGAVITLAEMIGALVWPDKDLLMAIREMPIRYPDMSDMSIGWLSYLQEQIEDPLMLRSVDESRNRFIIQLHDGQVPESTIHLGNALNHDFGILLDGILDQVGHALKSVAPESPVCTDLQDIQQAAQTAKEGLSPIHKA